MEGTTKRGQTGPEHLNFGRAIKDEEKCLWGPFGFEKRFDRNQKSDHAWLSGEKGRMVNRGNNNQDARTRGKSQDHSWGGKKNANFRQHASAGISASTLGRGGLGGPMSKQTGRRGYSSASKLEQGLSTKNVGRAVMRERGFGGLGARFKRTSGLRGGSTLRKTKHTVEPLGTRRLFGKKITSSQKKRYVLKVKKESRKQGRFPAGGRKNLRCRKSREAGTTGVEKNKSGVPVSKRKKKKRGTCGGTGGAKVEVTSRNIKGKFGPGGEKREVLELSPGIKTQRKRIRVLSREIKGLYEQGSTSGFCYREEAASK